MTSKRDTNEMVTDLKDAADRLLRGQPLRSDGRTNVASLMKEAGLSRVYAYREPYLSVVEWFKRQIDLGITNPAVANPNTEEQDSKLHTKREENLSLKKHLADEQALNSKLSSQVAYLTEAIIQLEEALTGRGTITPIRRNT